MISNLFVMGIIMTLAAEFAVFFLGAIVIAVIKTIREKHPTVATRPTDVVRTDL